MRGKVKRRGRVSVGREENKKKDGGGKKKGGQSEGQRDEKMSNGQKSLE